MPAQVVSAWRRLTSAVGAFSIAQRTIALIGVAVLVLGIAALASWMARPTYTPLFSGLEASDANAIVEQLRTDGIAYELSEGGATILVPETDVYDQRLKAASNGLPGSSGGGYALLDDMGVTSSEFQQSVTYKRALEGELASTISALNGVKTASVRLAIPEETVFVSERNNPTASVFVETESGVTLSADQVQAVVHLTSASIDGMKPNDVAVIDADGMVLSAVGVGVSGSAGDRATDYEDRVRTAVQSMLDQVVGPGNASVVVAADVNYESAERVEESFTAPEDIPALNESSNRESATGSGQGSAGVLGPDNIAVPGEDGESTFITESTVRNNAVNKVTESRVIPAGSIDRQTVSVAINGAVAGGLDMTEVSALVAAAAGIDDDRGDAVTVEVVNFNQAGAEAAAEALAAAEQAAADDRQGALVRTAIIAIGLIVPFVLGLIVYARRSKRQERKPVDIDLTEILTAPTIPITALAAAPLELSGQPIGTDATAMDRKRADIRSLAETDPEKTAEYLRGLMDDRQPA
ncbi:MAG: flagellar M-ring protein FliF [Microbacteriaceae bacterium]|nr:flagellar M-ring protein FliF [Microbacteriaceae bacterium]